MNSYEKEKKIRSEKFIKYRKFFNAKKINILEFEKKIDFYFNTYKLFWEWRENFKYPELNYLKNVKKVNPLPPENLIKELAKSISELKNIYLDLQDYRATIIFKLFFYYISQCLKSEFKVKYYKQSYFSDTPVDLDISVIISCIVEYFLDIKKTSDKDLPRKPWNSDPSRFVTDYISPLNHFRDYSEYNKHKKEIKKLLKLKNKIKILTIKHPISKDIYKVTPNEMIVETFFRLNLHNEKKEIEQIVFNKKIHLPSALEKRLIISKDKKHIELYWGHIQDGKPNGKGISEKYFTDQITKKVHKKLGNHWWQKYSTNLKAKDLKGYIIQEKYEGFWKNGKRDGKGKLTIFIDPAYESNKDGTPKIEKIEKFK